MERERMEALAGLVLAARNVAKKEALARGQKYRAEYLLNGAHPAAAVLYSVWRAGKPPQFPPGDMERTMFELSLLNEETLTKLENRLGPKCSVSPPEQRYRGMY